MSAFFDKIFGRKKKEEDAALSVVEEAPSPAIAARQQRAAESILENEALTADLDDQAAKVLLDWGVKLAQAIAARTAGLDAVAAEEAIYQPMRALRKMLRQINTWSASPNEPGLERIIEQAALSSEPGYQAPDADSRVRFLDQLQPGDPVQVIIQLRRFIENTNTN